MAFDATRLRNELESTGALLARALRSIDPSITHRHPEPDQWSILEIAAHLLDEERLDFGARTRSTIESPDVPWKTIDPESWVHGHGYAEWDYVETIEAFESERAVTIEWMSGVDDDAWTRAYHHPKVGPVAAGELLSAWVAHDLLHLAQLARTRAVLLESEVAPYTTRYANP